MKQDWYCQKCESYIDSKSVTFEETHDTCGHVVFVKPNITDEAVELSEKFYPGFDYVENGVDLNPAFRGGFVHGFSFNQDVLLDKLKECCEFLSRVQSPATSATYLKREIEEILMKYEN